MLIGAQAGDRMRGGVASAGIEGGWNAGKSTVEGGSSLLLTQFALVTVGAHAHTNKSAATAGIGLEQLLSEQVLSAGIIQVFSFGLEPVLSEQVLSAVGLLASSLHV
jgi:hypothetical protein